MHPFEKQSETKLTPYNTKLKEISKKLRHKPTEAERCLWRRLKSKHLGFVFHRQKPIGDYIVDFYCPEAKLVIEVDGGYHAKTEPANNDRVRDNSLKGLELTILRLSNSEVLNNTDKVVEKINKILLESSFDKE